MKLRPYQKRAVEHVMRRLPRAKTLLVVAPVATGKTTMFAECARHWAKAGKRVLVLVHKEELLKQAHARLAEARVKAGIIWRKHTDQPELLVHVSMIQTLYTRGHRPDADVVIIDEAHHSPSDQWTKVITDYPQIVGFTATPVREGNQPLTGYAELYEAITIPEAVNLKPEPALCPLEMKVYTTDPIGLDQVGRTGIEFKQGELGKAMSKRQVVGDIIDRWKVHSKGRSTLVFAATIAQSRRLVKAFRRAGVVAYHLDNESPDRAEVLARFDAGEFPVLCNVDLFGEGTDIPRVKCIVLARPTHSLAKYLQQVGRGRRPWNDQTCLVLDHGGLFGPHGHPDDVRDWAVGGAPVDKTENVVCSKCSTPRKRGAPCPNGCVFKCGVAGTEIEWVPHGYEYDAEQLRVLRDAQDKLIRDGYARNDPVSVIARRLGRTVAAVQTRASDIGASGLRRSFLDKRNAEILSLYAERRIPTSEIARRFRVTQASIGALAYKYGVRVETASHIRSCGQKKWCTMYTKHKLSVEAIAKKERVTANIVRTALQHAGIRFRNLSETKTKFTETDHAKWRRLYRSGWSAKAIGEKLGHAQSTVSLVIRKSGLTKSRSEAVKLARWT